MEPEQSVMLAVLSELMDSDDEKPTRRKTGSCMETLVDMLVDIFNNTIRELMIEDRVGFKEVFRMSVEAFEFVLKHMILFPPKR